MEESIYTNIMIHCSIMDQINSLTINIQSASEAGDVDKALTESENKQRAINNLAQIQTKIESILGSLQGPPSSELLTVLRAWANDFTAMTELWNQQDATTSVHLEMAREQTGKEIAAIFKSKERHKGYNLATVKK